jgi:replicative DNA helicase
MKKQHDTALEKGLPAAKDAEKLILGAVLSGQAAANFMAVLREHDFFLEKHRRIFAAMVHLESTGQPVDRVTVIHELERRNQLEAVGISYLCELDEGMPQVVSLDAWCTLVHKKSIARQAITLHQRAIEELLQDTDPPEAVLQRAERSIAALEGETRTMNLLTPAEILERAGGMTAIVNPDQQSCVKTPWVGLNSMLFCGGFMPGQLIVIGARPSIGKTALACQIADLTASTGLAVAFFTLEMSDGSILLRMAAARANVDILKVTQRRASPAEIRALTGAFRDLSENRHLFIDDSTGCTVPAMRAALRRLAARHSIRLVIVDYLQLVETTGGGARNRYEQVSEISRGIKRLAREFNVPVVVLAQLNRESEKESRRPRLSDFRDSGSIEQDGDVILLPVRQSDEHADVQAVDLNIAKQRNGPQGVDVPLKFLRRYAKFVDPDAADANASQANLGDVA